MFEWQDKDKPMILSYCGRWNQAVAAREACAAHGWTYDRQPALAPACEETLVTH